MDILLTPAEAGRLLHLSSRALANWGAEGRLTVVLTPTRQRRYRASQVYGLNGSQMPPHALESMASDVLLPPGLVAAVCGVQPATVSRWEREGRLAAERTERGHRRFKVAEVRRFLQEDR